MDGGDFTIPYIIDTIPNSPAFNQLPTQSMKILYIISINGEYPITSKWSLDKLNRYQTQRGKFKVNIILFSEKSYQRTYIEIFGPDLIKSDQ